MPIENPLVFYSRYAAEILLKARRYLKVYRACKAIYEQVMAAPDRLTYTDRAIEPVRDDEFETLDLYHETRGGEAALARKRRDDEIRVQTLRNIAGAPGPVAVEPAR
jgi:hypothetical protein